MVWEPEVEELRRRAALAARGGAPQRIERQHRLGRLTVRERIDGLLDTGSFHEVGALAGLGEYDDGELVGFTPASYVMGLGEIDGRTVAIGGEDFTIQGGSALFPMQRSKGGLGGFAEELAVEYKVPLILLIDGAGANVAATKKMGTTYLPNGGGTSFLTPIEAMQNVPVLAGVLGAIAGGAAGRAMMVHWSVMTRGRSAMFAAGPPVVRRGIGHEVTNEELGGSHVHVHESGCIDNEAEDEQDAFRQIRTMLSYLPDNVRELPPAASARPAPEGAAEALIDLVAAKHAPALLDAAADRLDRGRRRVLRAQTALGHVRDHRLRPCRRSADRDRRQQSAQERRCARPRTAATNRRTSSNCATTSTSQSSIWSTCPAS